MNPRDAVNAYGQLSPPPTAKNTMSFPMPAGASPARFAASPAPNQFNQMAQSHSMLYTESPGPINTLPYPVSFSRSTIVAPSETESALWARILELERMQQPQRSQQPPSNMAFPDAFPSQSSQYTQYPQHSQNFQHMHQPVTRDSGYGSGTFGTIGQGHGLQGQQPQASTDQSGHIYGKAIAMGNSRVIRGNVEDPTRRLIKGKQNIYGDSETYDGACMHNGNVTSQQFMQFYKVT